MSEKMKPGYKLTEVGVIPEDWEVWKLGERSTLRTGPFGSALHKSDYTDDGVPVINPTHIIDGQIVPTRTMTVTKPAAKHLTEFRLKAGDIIMGRRGDMGRCAVVQNYQAGWLCGTGSIIIRCANSVDPDYLQRVLSSPRTVAAIEDTSVGSTMINLNQGTLAGLRIQFPPHPEQYVIAGTLREVDALIGALDQLIAKKRDLKQAAMQQLLTGYKRLPGFGRRSQFKQTEVGLIPEDWRVETVGELSIVGRGRVISHREIAVTMSPLYPVYSSQTSYNGIMGYLDTFDFEGEYITWTTDGANAGTVFHRNGRFNCTNVCGTIKLKRDNAGFVSKVLAGIAPLYVSRNLGNPKLMNDVMKRIHVPLPPSIPEQTAIAEVLSDMDSELAALEARRDKTRALKQGMMQELLTGRTRLV